MGLGVMTGAPGSTELCGRLPARLQTGAGPAAVAQMGFLGPARAGLVSLVWPCGLGARLGLLRPLQVGGGMRRGGGRQKEEDPVWLALGGRASS